MKRTISTFAVLLAMMIAAPHVARADDPPPTKEELDKAKAAFNEANALYTAGKPLEAIVKLKESYRLSKNAFLLYNIGHSYDLVGQKDMVLYYFRRFLAAAPPDAPLRPEVTKRVAELNKEGVIAATSDDDTPPPPPPPPPPPKFSPTDFKHQLVMAVPPRLPIDITATVPAQWNLTLTLFYRRSGDETFTSKPMVARGAELVARIPRGVVFAKPIQYYIEVKDPDGKVVTRSGKSTVPNLVTVETGAAEHYDPVIVDKEDEASAAMLPPIPVVIPPKPPAPPGPPFRKSKWITTGAAGVVLVGSGVFYLLAKNHHNTLLDDSTGCGTPPCRPFDADYDLGLEERGLRYNTLYKVTLGVGAATAVLAGYFWYRAGTAKKQPADTQVSVVPTIGEGYAGAMAAARF